MTTTRKEAPIAPAIRKIAKQHLGIDILDTRNSDGLDFHDLSVWQIRAALEAAAAPAYNRAWTITMTDRMGNRFYLYRYGQGQIILVSKSETPNCLSNISQDGARFRLELERARNASEALQVVMNLATYAINAEIV